MVAHAPVPFWRRGIFVPGPCCGESDLTMARTLYEKQKAAMVV
jgi:hypothetical protein